ncbi:MAG: hypothetical protein ACQEQ4_04815 [Fibrobacterota bacterium]
MKTVEILLLSLFFIQCTLFAPDTPPDPDGGIADPLNLNGILISPRAEFESHEYELIFAEQLVFIDSRGNEWERTEFLERIRDIQTMYDTTIVQWSGEEALEISDDGEIYELPERRGEIFFDENIIKERISVYVSYIDNTWKITKWISREHDKAESFFSPEFAQ